MPTRDRGRPQPGTVSSSSASNLVAVKVSEPSEPCTDTIQRKRRLRPDSGTTPTVLLDFSDGNWGIRISMRCLLPHSGDIRRQPGSDQWTRLCRSVINDICLTMCLRGHSAVLLLLCLGFGLGTLRDAIALSAPVTMANYFCTPHQYRHQHKFHLATHIVRDPGIDYHLFSSHLE
jgi:hypothetical protein